ncbi:MAG: RHS repeat-associated core domain-containing protein, partial [Pirellulaceae bacterium]|nr:RHS repeat-associated core domain-containing protein [Pirellulaceae bacterium]
GFGYDASGKVNSLTDAAANQTTWVLDAEPESASFGRVLEETITIDDGNPLTDDAYTRYYAYDAAGRLSRYVDRMGRTTEYAYFASGDAEGRIQYEKWYAAGDDPEEDDPVRVIEYGYAFDAAGRLVEFTVTDDDFDPNTENVSFVYSYDAAGYLTSVAWDFAGLTVASGLPDVTLAYTYASGDLVGTQATIGATADFNNAYTYDSFGRLTRVTQTDVAGGNPVADKRADFAYTDAGQLKTIARYADLGGANLVATSTFTYDPSLGWLAGLVHEINNANQDVVAYAYTHQPDGQIDTLALDRDVDNTLTSETRQFTYDQQGQLIQVSLDAGGGPATVEQYQYDAAGNRVSATVGSASSGYTPGRYNRLESVVEGTDVWGFGYDAEGNLVLKFLDADESGSLTTGDTEVTEYAWDHRNRLVGVYSFDTFSDYATNPSQEVEYAYDYLNRLVARTVDGDREYFVYDHDAATNWGLKNLSTSKDGTIPFGANPATDSGQIVLQLDETGEPTHRYLWGPAVDMLLADEAVNSGPDQTPGTADDVRWTLGDHQNSVRDILVLDEVAEEWIVGNHVTYDAWGNTLAETDAAISGLFGWTGRFFDDVTDLQNNHQRWYDAVLAHWQSEVPIGFAAGDANLYRYCGNDPVNWIDPSGLVDGHHKVPRALWRWTGLDPDICKEVFDDMSARIFPKKGGHNYTAHGPAGYTGEVKSLMATEWQTFRTEKGIVRGMGTKAQQREFAKRVLDKIDDMPKDTYIGGFNRAVRRGGTPAVEKWQDKFAAKVKREARDKLSETTNRMREATEGGKLKKGLGTLAFLLAFQRAANVAAEIVHESDEVRGAKIDFLQCYQATFSQVRGTGRLDKHQKRLLWERFVRFAEALGCDLDRIKYFYEIATQGEE